MNKTKMMLNRAISLMISASMFLNIGHYNMIALADAASKDGDSPIQDLLDQEVNPEDEYLSMFPEGDINSFGEGILESPGAEPGEVSDEVIFEESVLLDMEEAPEEDEHFVSDPIVSDSEVITYEVSHSEAMEIIENAVFDMDSFDGFFSPGEIELEDPIFTQSADIEVDDVVLVSDIFDNELDAADSESVLFDDSVPSEDDYFQVEESYDEDIDFIVSGDEFIDEEEPIDFIDLGEEAEETITEEAIWFTSEEDAETGTETVIVTEGTCGDSLTWKFVADLNLLLIEGAGNMEDYVDSSATPWAAYQPEIKEIIVADGVTSIGMYAFAGCSALEKASLTDDIMSIGFRAFYNCFALNDVNIPVGWVDCPTSKEGTISGSYCGHIFEGCQNLKQVTIPEAMEFIPSYGFGCCDYLEHIILPDSITEIKNHTFYKCSRLLSVDIPQNVTYIGKSAFAYCGGLNSLTMNDRITELGLYAFFECTALVSLSLPDTIEKIGYQTFCNCSNLTEINIPLNWSECPSSDKDGTMNVDYCGHIFEGCKNLKSIDVPEGMVELPGFAFTNCDYLEEVNLPSTLMTIKNQNFYRCFNLLSITIPDGVTYIGKSAFCYCRKLGSITFPDGVTVISSFAFQECKELDTLDLPDSIEQIGYRAFADCVKLQNVHIPANWTTCPTSDTSGTINANYCGHIFEGCLLLKSIEVPQGCTSLPSFAFNASNYLEEVSLPTTLEYISNHSFFGCTQLKSINLPDGITSINKSAFYNCDALTDIAIPEGANDIGSYVFDSCANLMTVQLPDTIEKIGYRAFADCEKLEDINIPLNWNECPSSSSSNTGINYQGNILSGCTMIEQIWVPEGKTSVPDYAFCNCSYLRDVFLPDSMESIGDYAFYGCNNLTSINIPSGVTTIPDSAFSNCSALLVVNIPVTVETIEQKAFNNCASLNMINYCSSETDWSDIAVSTNGNTSLDAISINYDFSIKFTEEDFLGVWEGEYDGNSGSTIVRRHFVVAFDSCIRKKNVGKLSGTVTFSPSEKADSQYDANGSYYFGGTVNMLTGVFFYQGHTWIHYPEEYDNFQFVTFDGYYGLDKTSISGINERTASRTFDADLLGTSNTTSTEVILSRNGNKYNILQEEQQVETGSDEYMTVTVIPDWQNYTKGTIRLFQRNIAIESKSGVFIDLQLGKLFSPSERIYVALVDDTGKMVEIRRTKLTITSGISGEQGDLTVILDANGGNTHEAWSPSSYTMTFTIGAKYGYLPSPSRNGYKFAGWYTKKVGGTQITSTDIVVDYVTKLYARWKYENLAVEVLPMWGRSFRAYFNQDYFLNDSSEIQDGLMMLSALASYTTYYKNPDRLFYAVDNPLEMLEKCGFADRKEMFSKNGEENGHSNILSNNHGYFYIGEREIIDNDGNKDLLIGLIISGYSEGGYEWVSNFNVGSEPYHVGFKNAADEIVSLVSNYRDTYYDEKQYKSVKYWITGHSRGGALTNIVSLRLNDDSNVYAYGFATPRYKGNAYDLSGKHDNIINVISPDDFVPQVAPAKWKFKRYGQNREFNSEYRYEMKRKFYQCFSKEYGGYTTKEMMNLINAFTSIADSREAFNDRIYYNGTDILYPYDWAQHGIGYSMCTPKVVKLLGVDKIIWSCTFGIPFDVANILLIHDGVITKQITDAHLMESYLMWLFSGVELVSEKEHYSGGYSGGGGSW